ncbi:hypothetical protein N7448_006950 [Penicillium atrosanguineum]|nr:hypothetical protein N7448_006950 [Penicillium atrosanguineum]
MSSALNHARSLSGVSVRAAHLLGSCRKQHYDRDIRCALQPSRPRRYFQFNTLLHTSTTPVQSNSHDGPPTTTEYEKISKPSKLRPKTKPKPTPSEYLAKSLQRTRLILGSGERSTRAVDLSYVNPDRKVPRRVLQRHRGPKKTYGRPDRQSLQTILGEYIRLVEPSLSRTSKILEGVNLDFVLTEVFRTNSQRFLTERGYDIEDVVSWAWIMKSQTHHQAISRMFALEADSKISRVPTFIPLFLLKEPHLDAQSFRLLLIHSLHLMSGQPFPALDALPRDFETHSNQPPTKPRPAIDRSTCMILVVRLIRHARQVWPEALPIIARSFSRFLTAGPVKETRLLSLAEHKADGFRTAKFNSCLELLSLPTKIHPFRSSNIQQEAQFELLRAMATHKPVLPLNRRGYRAVIAVQMAHKKTAEERQSAELKAPSWPPWKEARLGIDTQRGNEGIISRAMNVLSQMKEAGYSHQTWEEMCSVLAGWDTDGSPTVQTRSLVHQTGSLSREHNVDSNHYAVWVARIRATRTVREAWACFLAYRDQNLPQKAAIHVAIAEKLIYREKAVKRGSDHKSSALPGDGREVHPEPASARDLIYVKTEPPSSQEFLDQILSDGFRPSGRFLALLLESTSNFRLGVKYLQYSDLTDEQITALCTPWYQQPGDKADHIKALQSLPNFVFAAFIKLLCSSFFVTAKSVAPRTPLLYHFPVLMAGKQSPGPMSDISGLNEELGEPCHPRSLWHAIQLVKLLKPACHQAWSHILNTLSQKSTSRRSWIRSCLSGTLRDQDLYRILVWQEVLAVLRLMKARKLDLGMKNFQFLCLAFKRAVDAGTHHDGLVEEAARLIQKPSLAGINCDGQEAFDAMVANGLEVLKSQFDGLVLPASKTSELAERSIFTIESEAHVLAGLHVPSYATLHSFVRVLGLVGDDEGLLYLLRWMSESATRLNEVADEELNGEVMKHQTFTAIRVFLEKLHRPDDARVASDRQVQEAYDLVSQTPGWEWPSDEDVEEYLE